MSALSVPDICDRFAMGYCRKVARDLVKDGIYARHDLADLVQELTVALLESRDAYDPAKARWTYYVKTVVDRKAVSLRRTQSTESRGNTVVIASLNVLVMNGEGERVELSQQVCQEERGLRRGIEHADEQSQLELSLNVAEVVSQLDEELATICRLLSEKSVAEVARELGMPRTTLISRLAKVRERFVEAGLDPAN